MVVITVSGPHGSGKSTIAREIAKRLGLRYVSAGEIFRRLAREMGMDVVEFSKYVEKHPEIDKMIDEKMAEEAKRGNVVLDSLLAFHFAREANPINILVTADKLVRAERIAKRDGKTFEEALREIEERERSERERFKRLYGIELWRVEDFDIVINTTRIDKETAIRLAVEVCKILLEGERHAQGLRHR